MALRSMVSERRLSHAVKPTIQKTSYACVRRSRLESPREKGNVLLPQLSGSW